MESERHEHAYIHFTLDFLVLIFDSGSPSRRASHLHAGIGSVPAVVPETVGNPARGCSWLGLLDNPEV